MLARPLIQPKFRFGTIVLATLVMVGCGSRNERVAIRQYATEANYDAAKQSLNELYSSRLQEDNPGSTDRISGKNGLLWSLDRGILATLAGEYDQAYILLDTASNLVEEYRQDWTLGNISREIGAAVVNDTIRRYDGNAYEHIQVQFWRALNEVIRAQLLSGRTGELTNPDAAFQHYQNAVSFSRKMVLNQIQETADAAEGSIWRKTYIDDPFARLFSAALMLSLPKSQRSGSDLQFAQTMLKKAWETYGDERKDLNKSSLWRYESIRRQQNQTLISLMHRVGMAYDPAGWQRYAEQEDIPSPQTAQLVNGSLQLGDSPPQGHGSVLLLNLVDLIAFNEVLEVYLAAGTIPGSYKRPRKYGDEVESFSLGAIAVVVRGPGASVAQGWGAIPVPGKISDALAPGGISIMGTEIPVHAPDLPIAQPAQLVVASEQSEIAIPLEVLSDLDAYARATLKDEQPAILIRTLLRTAAKQLIAASAANEAKKESPLWGALVGLGGSLLMTASEVADLRGSLVLPNTIQGCLVDLPAGSHQLVLEQAGQRILLGQVDIVPDELVILPVRSFPSTMTTQNP